ncbi:histone H1B-like [Belonocnema kinseyi]|uniref:histone H1B-like n=1 Tax=Belonocnema kinseyi TaxID=2817044 RepID=UPI00143DB342|nr:histone H1B-like [Belonocnema kinseyi]
MADSQPSTSKFTHPSTSKMVETAILEMKERKGSSVQAIKKYIATHFDVDIDVIYPRIKKYLKKAVEEGILVQVTGIGASGSFKFSKHRKDEIKKEEKAETAKLEKKTEDFKDQLKKKKVTQKKKATEKKKPVEKKKTMPKVKAIKA